MFYYNTTHDSSLASCINIREFQDVVMLLIIQKTNKFSNCNSDVFFCRKILFFEIMDSAVVIYLEMYLEVYFTLNYYTQNEMKQYSNFQLLIVMIGFLEK